MVELRNKNKLLVINILYKNELKPILLGDDGAYPLEIFTNDLTHKISNSQDIIAVYDPNNYTVGFNGLTKENSYNLHKIWEGNEVAKPSFKEAIEKGLDKMRQ